MPLPQQNKIYVVQYQQCNMETRSCTYECMNANRILLLFPILESGLQGRLLLESTYALLKHQVFSADVCAYVAKPHVLVRGSDIALISGVSARKPIALLK